MECSLQQLNDYGGRNGACDHEDKQEFEAGTDADFVQKVTNVSRKVHYVRD